MTNNEEYTNSNDVAFLKTTIKKLQEDVIDLEFELLFTKGKINHEIIRSKLNYEIIKEILEEVK